MDNLVLDLRDEISVHFKENEDNAKKSCEKGTSAMSTTLPQAAELDAKPLKVKNTVTYIVSGVVIKDGRVLMMREAKKSCRGLWYLPAGRVERNETLVDAVSREVVEETGMIFEPTALISVEYSSLDWYRFNFIGRITGGKLKTKEDKESLEAGWFTPDHVFNKLPLRARDIFPIISLAFQWNETKISDPLFNILPHQMPHSRISAQIVVISKRENGINVLIDNESVMGFLEINYQSLRIPVNLKKFVLHVANGMLSTETKKEIRVHGIMRVEHNGGPYGVADGIQLTFLVEVILTLPSSEVSPSLSSRYKWCPINDESLCTKLNKLTEMGCIKKEF